MAAEPLVLKATYFLLTCNYKNENSQNFYGTFPEFSTPFQP